MCYTPFQENTGVAIRLISQITGALFKSETRLKRLKSQNSDDLEFWLFGLFKSIFDLNTSSCGQIQKYSISGSIRCDSEE